MENNYNLNKQPDFSLVLGGPLFQLLIRLGLSTPTLELLKRRIICITLFAWLPLFLFSLFDNKALNDVQMPFLYDIETQARFLIALPLLIAAEFLVHKRLRLVVGQFVDSGIITEEVLPKFRELITSAMKLRNSISIELTLLLLIFIGGHSISNTLSGLKEIASFAGTWYGITDVNGTDLTLAGYWYIFVSRPFFQFIIFRWYFRLFIWARFMWQTSRLKLTLIPTHPDRAAGLGFLGLSSTAFAPVLIAQGVLLAGIIADLIFFAGQNLTDSLLLITGIVLFLLTIVLGPLLVFMPNLLRTKRIGLIEYGKLASRYVSEFDLKWMRGGATSNEPLVGSADIQSLADIGNSFQVIRDIRPFPFGKDTVIQIVAVTLIPVLPLVLTMIHLEELITKLFNVIF